MSIRFRRLLLTAFAILAGAVIAVPLANHDTVALADEICGYGHNWDNLLHKCV